MLTSYMSNLSKKRKRNDDSIFLKCKNCSIFWPSLSVKDNTKSLFWEKTWKYLKRFPISPWKFSNDTFFSFFLLFFLWFSTLAADVTFSVTRGCGFPWAWFAYTWKNRLWTSWSFSCSRGKKLGKMRFVHEYLCQWPQFCRIVWANKNPSFSLFWVRGELEDFSLRC